MGAAHARAYSAISEAALTTCFDVDREKARAFAAQYRIPSVATDLDGLLADVDAVAVVTPDRFHAPTTLAVLRAGKHVMCEKPLTATLEEAREVARAAADSDRVHMVNFSYRESAAFQRAIELVRGGHLGKLRHCHSLYLQCWLASSVWGSWTQPSMLWKLDSKLSGGVLGDIGCHILDMTTAIAGEVRRVRCALRSYPKEVDGEEVTAYGGHSLDANDTALIELEFADGCAAIVQTSRWATGRNNQLRCEVHGTRGALRVDLDRSYTDLDVCLGADVDRSEWRTQKCGPSPSNYRRFIDAIVHRVPATPDILRGAQVQAYLDACERSAVSGGWEEVLAWT